MEQSGFIVVLITTKDIEEADRISQSLVRQRLAACVNVVPEVNSHFRWENKLENVKESLLVVKTKEVLLPEVIKAVKSIHSYSVPEIIALPIIGGSTEYLDWVDNEVTL